MYQGAPWKIQYCFSPPLIQLRGNADDDDEEGIDDEENDNEEGRGQTRRKKRRRRWRRIKKEVHHIWKSILRTYLNISQLMI